MKIRIIKDIPGYKAGEIITLMGLHDTFGQSHSYKANLIIQDEFAEELKEEIDIEEIRKIMRMQGSIQENYGKLIPQLTHSEAKWFTAYRIVKAVIEQLNGDWNSYKQQRYWIVYHEVDRAFVKHFTAQIVNSQIPPCNSQEVADKVILLCDPELRILFNVNKE